MLIVSNRMIEKNEQGLSTFGEKANPDDPSAIRLARVAPHDPTNPWGVEIIPEIGTLTKDNLPSKGAIIDFINECIEENKNCLFYIHGFNASFKKALQQASLLEKTYGVKVILFTWPSNSSNVPIYEYKKAKRAAMRSAMALDNILEKLSSYLLTYSESYKKHNIKINLMAYSMGNFLFKTYIEGAEYDNETRMFHNVVLCQADCDNENHWQWVDKIQSGKRVYITINESDSTLHLSDLNFQKDRLGNTARDLNSRSGIYIDVTNGDNVGSAHRIWDRNEVNNQHVTDFFQLAFEGKRAEDLGHFNFDVHMNRFRL